MSEQLQSYSITQFQATCSINLVPYSQNSEPSSLQDVVSKLSKPFARQAFQNIFERYREIIANRKSNLAYVFIDRLPKKYQKDMNKIVDYYEKALLDNAAKLQRADIKLEEARKKVKTPSKQGELGFWEVRRLRSLQIERQQMKQEISQLKEQLQHQRNKKPPNLDCSCVTVQTCDQSTFPQESLLQQEVSRLKQQLRFFNNLEQQTNISMSNLVSQMIEQQNTIQGLQNQISELNREIQSTNYENTRLQEEVSDLKFKMAECVRSEQNTSLQNQILEGVKNDLERELRRLKTDVLRMEIGETYKKESKSPLQNISNIRELQQFFSPIMQQHRHSRSRSKQNIFEPPKTKFTLSSLKSAIKSSASVSKPPHISRLHTRSIL